MFDSLEHKFDTLEHKFETLEHKFDSLEHRFDSLEHRFLQAKRNIYLSHIHSCLLMQSNYHYQ